jgi:hypothetical protein
MSTKSRYKDLDKYRANKKKHRDRRKLMIREAIESKRTPCLFCGSEDDIQYHHVDPTVKDGNINYFYVFSVGRALEEFSKCWCLCKECHVKLHQRLCDPLPSCYDDYVRKPKNANDLTFLFDN